jgi:hypothetical protein
MRVFFAGLALFGLAAGAPRAQEVLTNADIVKMSSLQLSSQAIVLKIESSVTRFDTSPEALAVLKAAGVPDLAIEAMIMAEGKAVRPAAGSPPVSASTGWDATSQASLKATVFVYRPGKFFGKALEPSVFLDEQKVLDMDNGRYLTLSIPAGRHILRSNEKNSEIDQVWQAGQTYFVKITIAAGMMKGHGQMGMVTEKLALAEMKKLRPLNRENVTPAFLDAVDFTPVELRATAASK